MTGSKPTLNLVDIRDMGFEKEHFRINSMKNTILFKIGQRLSSTEVQTCINQGWNINIVEIK